jgi:ABC-type cobalt transport system substrate-binding protein
MKNQQTIVLILVAVIVGVLAWLFFSNGLGGFDATNEQAKTDPLDVAPRLYSPWLSALQATSTEPDFGLLLTTAPITPELRSRLQQHVDQPTSNVDPVICQPIVPGRLGAKVVYITDDTAELMVVTRGNRVPEMALYTLQWQDSDWIISDITCSRGEIAPEQEYSFEREGNLLKDSLQPPLDSSKWHLIYTRDDVAGYAIPLEFNESSVCISDVETVCDQSILSEAASAKIQGAMLESGVLVERLELQ